MRLNAIKLEQWRCFDDCYLEFPDGVIGVRGLNGAGKTTLVEAIGWALFGKVRGGRREGLSIADLKRQDRPADTRSAVTLWFQLGGVQYRVERVVSGTTKLWIGDDSEPETTQTAASNKRLIQELGVTWDMFTRTTFAQQKEVAALSANWSAAERRTHVERLLGLGRYGRAAEAARAEVRRLTAELSGRRSGAPDVGQAVAALREAEGAAAAGDPAVTAAKAAADAAEAAREAADEAVRVEAARRADADLLQQKLGDLRDALAEAQPRAERLRETVAEQERNVARVAALNGAADLAGKLAIELAAWDRLQAAERSLDEARTRLDALAFNPDALASVRATVERLTVEQEQLSGAAASRQRRIEAADARVEALVGAADAGATEQWVAKKDAIALELAELRRREAVVEAELSHDRDHLDVVQAGGPETPCPVCRKPFGETYEEILAGYHERISVNAAERQALADRAAELERSLQEVSAACESARDADRKLAETSGAGDIDEARREAATAREAEAKAAGRNQEINAELNQARTALEQTLSAEVGTAAERRQIEALELERTEALAAIECGAYEEAAHADIRGRSDAAAAAATELATLTALIETHQGAATDLGGLEDRIKRLEADMAEATERLSELSLDPAALDSLNAARDARRQEWQAAHEAWTQARINATATDERVAALRYAHAAAVAEHQEIERCATLLRMHDLVASILTGYRDHQRMRAWPHLERAAGELLAATTDGRYADVRFAEDDCRLTIVDRGEPHRLGRYSGGEQDLANLCLRLAIAQWVSEQHGTELDFVVLDEVFGSQDENRRERLIDTLNGLGERFRQVFVVTHVDEIAERCDSQVDVVLDEPGRSAATLIAPML